MPKSAYINVNDFKTPKELADYLLYLDTNPEAYNFYFKWKKYAQFYKEVYFSPICDMCIKLHLESYYGLKYSIIKNITKNWNRANNCLN